jgi:hypothetical protein
MDGFELLFDSGLQPHVPVASGRFVHSSNRSKK